MMKLSHICDGQTVEPCPNASETPADKWALLDALTHAAVDFGLSHRTLGVLRALLTFFPDRLLPAGSGAGVVYPSNRVLSQRLNGMPESTLRRHLAALVQTGLIDRQDSANRKRFAHFGGVAFGFDLSPLARCAPALLAAAERARDRQAYVASLRAQIAACRQQLLDLGHDAASPLLEEARLALRRKLSVDPLTALAERLSQLLAVTIEQAIESTVENPADESLETGGSSKKLSASPNQNERHIQTTDKSESVIKPKFAEFTISTEPPAMSEIMESCHEYQDMFPTPRPDWPQLMSVAQRLHGMMGIDAQVYTAAQQELGHERAATVILCMLETIGTIRKPGAYLRGLIQRSERGLFNMSGMLKAARMAGGGKLSADNLA